MGVVYKAEDTKLKREVAIKFLPRRIDVSDEERQRFKLEAQAAAALNHNNIATVYEIDEVGDDEFIVMEIIKGESLKEKIAKGPLKLDEAMRIATEVAEGLHEAHEHKIVHRDIKPANIMLTTKGQCKIMDFGLAKMAQATLVTKDGTTLGTAAYMSPEQAQGVVVDHRADVWSLGVVLYEMLTGQLPFKGDYEQAVTYSILHEDPEPITGLRTGVPMELERVVDKCLQKEASDRYQGATELLVDLRQCQKSTLNVRTSTAPVVTSRNRYSRWAVFVAAVLFIALVYALFLSRSRPKEIKLGRTKQITNQPGLELYPTISPDGNMIAYSAGAIGQMHIYVRQIAGGRSVALTEDIPGDQYWPQWSPDGTAIAYASDGIIYRISALGGIPKRMAEPPNAESWLDFPVWSPDGRYFAYVHISSETVATVRIQSVDGNESRGITDGYELHSLSWSHDGEWIAFVSGNVTFVGGIALGNIAPSSIWVVSARGGEPVQVTDNEYLNTSPVWTPDGKYLLYVSNQGGNRDVYQLPIGDSGTPSGPPMRLTAGGLDAHTIHLSTDGKSLAYSVFTKHANIWSVPIPREGPISGSEAEPVTTGNQIIEGFDVSLDGKWIAFDSNRSGNQDIYRMPIAGGEPEQLTNHRSGDFGPAWSPDGREIVFYSLRNGNRDIFVMSADGRSLQQLTEDPAQDTIPNWAPDGRQILFRSDKTGRSELYLISRETVDLHWGKPGQLTFDGAWLGGWSPDGQLIAINNSNGLSVISPDGGDSRLLVQSTDHPAWIGGWSPDSRTVYYNQTDAEGRFSFWSIKAAGGKPKPLLRFDDLNIDNFIDTFIFATDGERFFFISGELESDVWVMELITDE